MENHLTPYQSVITEIKSIISSGQEAAYSASSKAMLLTYWNIGKRIVEQELAGSERAEYGKGLISALAEDLTKEFGKNYSKRNLHYYIKFYQCFPDEQIVNACVHNLNWTHIRSLLRVADENARYWYMKEAVAENWSSRTLDRNISTQYYNLSLIHIFPGASGGRQRFGGLRLGVRGAVAGGERLHIQPDRPGAPGIFHVRGEK